MNEAKNNQKPRFEIWEAKFLSCSDSKYVKERCGQAFEYCSESYEKIIEELEAIIELLESKKDL